MTNEEAIKWFESTIQVCHSQGEALEAMKTAIKALEQLQEKPEYIDIWNVGAILRNVPEQPDICKIYGGVCGYPIEACSECPKHEGWRPSKEQTRWIPCSERLPESDDEVLVTDDAGGLALVGIDWFDSDSSRWWCSQNVTAWKLLPQPYKAESEG